ncbi:F-box protein [Acorus gramineus]|uniref:F-box protein n=1 Tax=Acorus gramineus TaxID=55184 RepID=A0AAV9AEK2_ACOGR|nr:F-box protein [Acorus gramineus]
MEKCWDLLEWVGPDMSINVFSLLDDPKVLVRAGAVSRSWRRFVIENAFCKKLYMRIFPEASCLMHVVEVENASENAEAGSSSSAEWESLEREHRVYALLLAQSLSSQAEISKACIIEPVSASSTDNFPDESIVNTLEPNDRVHRRPSYWSSDGERDPGVPESLTYRLKSKLCFVSEISVQPFQAFFQHGHPIYSSKAVRIRMGYSKNSEETNLQTVEQTKLKRRFDDDDYIWTYVSPEYPMAQENILQSFKLPRPVICVGGIVRIELLGRVQKQDMDGLYYICVCHVQVIGRPLSPAFEVDFLRHLGSCVLKYFPGARDYASPKEGVEDENGGSSSWHAFATRIRMLRAGRGAYRTLLNTLLGDHADEDDDVDESDDEVELLEG